MRTTSGRRAQLSRILAFTVGVVGCVTSMQARAQVTAIQPLNPQAKPPWEPKSLSLQPAAQPVPMLKYRFLPSEGELLPGDAAPIYLRLRHELPEEAWKGIDEKYNAWFELPLTEIPLAEAVPYIQSWGPRLKQLEFGSRRAQCDWNYTWPEQRLDAIEILLPDAQAMRTWGRLLALKARVEIAEGKPEAAIATLETGLAFGRHVGAGPFLINRLVGIAICQMMVERVEELVQTPGCPNLYWALTVLPRPLIDMRSALELEQRMVVMMVPELEEKPREEQTPAEWAVVLKRLEDSLDRLTRKVQGNTQPKPGGLKGFWEAWSRGSLKGKLLTQARQVLPEGRGWTAEQVNAMSDDEVVVRLIRSRYQEVYDAAFAPAYLPDLEQPPAVMNERDKARIQALKTGPLPILAEWVPAIQSARHAGLRLDRRIAALRAVEALRMQAAVDGGKLPEDWSGLKVVPVPLDPATGAAFSLKMGENGLELVASPVTNIPAAGFELGYRIAIRP